MLRDVNLSDISDGRLYTAEDLVKAGCGDCSGCSECCRRVGDTIIIDPRDVFELIRATGQKFDRLLETCLELNVKNGIILPNLKLVEGRGCAFLDGQGRCSIHGFRPGFCRLFPLGRIYEDGKHMYFNQIHECPKPDKSKVRVRKWIGIEPFDKYEAFVDTWHDFIDRLQKIAVEGDETVSKNISIVIIKFFYNTDYDVKADFYEQFYRRISYVKGILGIL